MDFLDKIKFAAKASPKRIVLPEGGDERILKAADRIIAEGLAEIVILGNKERIAHLASELYLENISGIKVIDPENNPDSGRYVELMLSLRAAKGLTPEQAEEQVKDPLCLAAVMVKAGDADGEVAGAANATSNVLRPAFQYVRTLPGVSVVSGVFIMLLQDKVFGEEGAMIFADCAVHPDPTAEQLAEIAVMTGHTTRAIAGFEPRIALLSFSTKGSASHAMVDKVAEATRLARLMAPDMMIDGEMQADAAIVPGIGASKAPGSPVAGKANVLIFPSLETGNIAYKLVQRLAHAQAIGPVLQGMASPINDLSRGCSVEDIVNLVAITSCQATAKKK